MFSLWSFSFKKINHIKILENWAVVGYKVEAEIVLRMEIGCRLLNPVSTGGQISPLSLRNDWT